MQKIPLTYQLSPLAYFDCIHSKDWAILLDSGHKGQTVLENGRYDIITAEPLQKLVYENNNARVLEANNIVFESEDGFDALAFMQKTLPNDLPNTFAGGVLGYLSYALGSTTYKPAKKNNTLPLIMAGLYQWCLLTDHLNKTTCLLSWDDTYDLTQWQKCFTGDVKQTTKNVQIKNNSDGQNDYPHYLKAFNKIKQYLVNGDCYQVNYAQKFSYQVKGSAYAIYKKLKKQNNVSFGAFMHYPQFKVLSFSPECFLSLQKQTVKTYPIKGTSKRYKNKVLDEKSKQLLIKSKKDQAENLMIVDLMRNDLGQVCSKGSIKVTELFTISSYRYVHHMQSKIEGVLAVKENALSLLKSCFPGGSVTGAPKKRAMQIIDELETDNRELYCGSIFYMTKRVMLSNIAIRTAVHKNNTLNFWAGGAVVNDSDVQSEYQEMQDKAKVFSNLIEK